jgi:hypothetical protein
LRDYAPRVSHYTQLLIQAIQSEVGNPMDIARWFNYYSFDVMGDLSFGTSFDMLVDGKDAYILKQLHADMKSIGLFSHLTWLFPFFKRIPVLNADYLKFWNWVNERVEERIQASNIPSQGIIKRRSTYKRMQNSPGRPDVFSWILKDYEQHSKTNQNTLDLHGDAYLIIVAGRYLSLYTQSFPLR